MNKPHTVRLVLACVLGSVLLGVAASAAAQSGPAIDDRPAFSLASGHIATTKERPTVTLMHRRVRSLDFRIYRINDPLAFFAGLADPHALGSEAPVVPQERSWLERLAEWKAGQRGRILSFFRGQLSYQYRLNRQEASASRQVALRQTLDHRQFAQVPLLNANQLVTSWREMLPMVRDTEVREIPLDVKGEGVYVVEAVSAPYRAYTIVIVSDLGLVTKAAPAQLLMFAANRFTGEPASGCQARVLANKAVVATGTFAPDGTFDARIPDAKIEDVVAIARCGQQVAATDPGGWFFRDAVRVLTGYVYTDKPIYRPGHVVHLKGILRWRQTEGVVPFDRKQVEVTIADPNDKVVFRQPVAVDEFGAVLATFPVPRTAALGYYAVSLNSQDDTATGSFEVQEYRKPDFEVKVTPASRFVMQGTPAAATITARYYFGQPVAHGEVAYVVHRQPYYSPLRWSDDEEDGEREGWYGGEQQSRGTARLDERGTAEISVPLEITEGGRDYSLRIEARVTDVSSREVSGSALVHATHGRFLLTTQSDSYSYRPGAQATLSVKALDYLGAEQPGVSVTVALERVRYPEGRWEKPTVTRVAEGHVTTDASGAASWAVTVPQQPGSYQLRAEARSEGRRIWDTSWIWVAGRSGDPGDSERDMELVLDRKTYAPGDVAHISIKGEVQTAAMLVTKEGQQVSWRQVVRPAGSGALVIDVPIAEADIGDIWVAIACLKDDRLYRAEKRLKVPARPRQLTVTIAADRAVAKPRQTGTFTVTVVDAAGKPVRAQVSVGVIDEAVYGVRPDTTPDPLRVFHRREYSRVGTDFSREYYFVGYSGTQQLRLAQRRLPMTLADFKSDRPAQPQVRKDFPDAIHWIGNLVTGTDGTARLQVTYPDSLTTWRLTARAVTVDTHVGTTVARTMVTKDLIVRLVPPRFLTEGDEVGIPTIVHNYLPATAQVALTLQADGVGLPAGQAAPPSTQTVTVPQGGEVRSDWRVLANRVGTATFTATATTDLDQDAVELPVPVQPFGLKRRTAAAGSIAGAGEAAPTLTIPTTANPAARTVRVALASSLAGPLLGALDFLNSYPYGCTEQTLSSFLPNLMVVRALEQLKIAPTERLQALDRQVSEGLQRLYDYQHEDGGWGWWKTDENHPFMTAYALYGLVEAQRAGYTIEDRAARGARALRKLRAEYPRAVPDLKAYMTYVLTLTNAAISRGEGSTSPHPSDLEALEDLWRARDRLSPYGQAFLLLTLDGLKDSRGDQVAQAIAARAQKKGDLVWWSVSGDPLLDDYGDTGVEATAFVVKALSARNGKDPLLEPAVRWLLLNRNYGTWWSSTKQTAMVLYGLLDFMKARHEGAGDSTVEILVNGVPAGSTTFTAASLTAPDPVIVTAPAAEGANRITIRTRGTGTVYWAATAEYYDISGPLSRTGTRKLAITRKYYALTPVTVQNRIVYRETPFEGQARPGDVLLVRLDVAGAPDWRYLMVEDPIPAGVEAVRQRGLYTLERRQDFWDGSRREYRDDRIVFFQESFTAGHYQYVYLLKVTTPGVFRAMPAQVSAMYVPDANASSEPQTLTVGADAPRTAGTLK